LYNPSEATVKKKMVKKLIFNGIIRGVKWIDLGIPAEELRPDASLISSQCNSCDNFNWKRVYITDEHGIVSSCWIGMLDSQALAIRQTDTTTLFANILTSNASILNKGRRSGTEIRQLLRDYFQTGHNLEALYSDWSEGCERMKVVNKSLKGVRILRQDPFECLISFICSTNNNINRISIMLDRLRCRYGRYVCTVKLSTYVSGSKISNDCWRVSYEEDDGQSIRDKLATALCDKEVENIIEKESINGKSIDSKSVQTTKKHSVKAKGPPSSLIHHLFEFPTIEALALASEVELIALGMGYRAKFIRDTALLLAAKKGIVIIILLILLLS
jgi:N-glycosylase/DNA lyase